MIYESNNLFSVDRFDNFVFKNILFDTVKGKKGPVRVPECNVHGLLEQKVLK